MNYPFIVLAMWTAVLWGAAIRFVTKEIRQIKDDQAYFFKLQKDRILTMSDRTWEIQKELERHKLIIEQMHAEIMPDVNTAPDVKSKRRRAKKTKQEDTARIANLDDS